MSQQDREMMECVKSACWRVMDLCDYDQQADTTGTRWLAYLIPSVVRMSGIIGEGADKLPLFPGIEMSNAI